jgi:acyl-CoA synthetase (AMP-forming)/AMP-acid ligase II
MLMRFICCMDRYMGAGGASTGMPVLQFFEDIGVPICEGYGLTETAPVITNGTVESVVRGCRRLLVTCYVDAVKQYIPLKLLTLLVR